MRKLENFWMDHKKILISLIIALGVGGFYFILEIPISNVQKSDVHDNSSKILAKTISEQSTMSAYRDGQPFSLQWTDCIAPDPEKNLNGEYNNSTLILKPMLLDKTGSPATIKFNTSYFFSVSDTEDTYQTKLHPIQPITMHLVDPSNRAPVILNLTDTFNEAKQLGVYKIGINLIQSSVAPYSDDLGKNMVDYTNDRSERVVTQFMYLYIDNQHKWIETHDLASSMCNHLVKK